MIHTLFEDTVPRSFLPALADDLAPSDLVLDDEALADAPTEEVPIVATWRVVTPLDRIPEG
ncbi:MAG: hypothetical protein H6737_28290 [Alphaproteobacteria bacterium]|nr:hypothetical protein [Alphaproteobacteria bacterium]